MDTKLKSSLNRILFGTYLRRIIIMAIFSVVAFTAMGCFVNDGIYILRDKKTFIKIEFIRDAKAVSSYIYSYTDYMNKIRNEEISSGTFKRQFMHHPVSIYIVDNKTGKTYTNINTNINKNEIENYIKNNSFDYYKKGNEDIAPFILDDNEHLKYLKTANEFTEYYWYDINYENLDQSIPSIINRINVAKEQLKIIVVWLVFLIIFIFDIISYVGKYDKKKFQDNIKSSTIYKLLKKVCSGVKKMLSIVNTDRGTNGLVMLLTISLIVFAIVVMVTMHYLDCYGNSNWVFFSGIVYMIAYISIITYILSKKSRYFHHIVKNTELISKGDFSIIIEENGNSPFAKLAKNINTIRYGYSKALEERIQNERLKTELISNVSHDLKTPLTSIINYIDILGREDISEEEKRDYLKILENKSLRLKTLIEDLFQISKINSGNIEIHREDIDIVELIQQVLGEYSNYYSGKNIKFKLNSFKDKVILCVDGKQISRAIENLVSNALKYSMENTRVYIDISEKEGEILISFKNIASYEMNFDVEEIFERFKRADQSRNSQVEGSGLGLAIAKSIVEIHGGSMYIDKEGDLFKVFIILNNN
ncbi:sensor histidine kinase [Clostridium lundense]|uniref:sensor histidine kinase n=1 Tax=Clostridium lundense TaxID=319475 RepID=UPI000684EAFE|nr:HAMP domain-containing sensor histidine kinase [Clostridium lundense]